MKKVLAILLAALLAFSCAAVAETTINASLTIDREAALSLMEMFGVGEEESALADTAIAVLSALGGRLTIAETGAELDLSLKGKDVIALAGAANETGINIVSNLFPSYALSLSFETIEGLLSQSTSQTDELNIEGLLPAIEAISGYANEYIEACTQSVTFGEPETGSYEFEGRTFNTKLPIDVDTEAIVAAAQTFVDQLAADEAVQAALASAQAAGTKVDLSDVNLTAETVSAVEAYAYMNADDAGEVSDDTYVTVAVTAPEADAPATLVNVLVADGAVKVEVSLPDQDTTTTVNVVPAEAGANVRVDVKSSGLYGGIAVNAALGETVALDCDLYVLDDAKPLASGSLTIADGGALTLSTDAADKKVLAVEDLMNDTEGEAAGDLLMDVLMNGLGDVVGAATEAMPDEIGTILNLVGLGDAA